MKCIASYSAEINEHDTESVTTSGEDKTFTPPDSNTSPSELFLSRSPIQSHISSVGQVPYKGQSYTIRDPQTNLFLGVEYGELKMVSWGINSGREMFWHCDEHEDRYLGFRNLASGTYMGHDGHGKFVAVSRTHHDPAGCFFWPRQCPITGGQILFVKRQHYFWVWHEPVKTDHDTALVVTDRGGEGTPLEFTRLECI
ncbi:hypothetical protein N7468_001804 [Penicillium chermesinum]|uniref:Uncharacterized protein n=1 Tax=Penicillium chermesinum TaxID=63820 RepID=A0A9W9PIY2_9EURO|nr:uncharacterized protein N7468_001804 [Penicillium chermesinum]KAJ5246821.1 hypothetical protein N7468_001804 [Penicillium chermesinum]